MQFLKEKYENYIAIFTNAMEKLQYFQKSTTDTVVGLQNLYAVIFETQQTLKNLNFQFDAVDPIIAYLAIDKLPPETRKEFEKNAVKKRDLPTFVS